MGDRVYSVGGGGCSVGVRYLSFESVKTKESRCSNAKENIVYLAHINV